MTDRVWHATEWLAVDLEAEVIFGYTQDIGAFAAVIDPARQLPIGLTLDGLAVAPFADEIDRHQFEWWGGEGVSGDHSGGCGDGSP
ncbi:hypothetical protein [Bradyrhizobium sp. Leo121]|uniref:hypothetical protein n=1 Tax=Bradyrhizobium sp. Leo121 TaxID=1571195 RepID=UPI001029D338|nr:hypothetical protein [Bradyrhizobium sp. Leo121]